MLNHHNHHDKNDNDGIDQTRKEISSKLRDLYRDLTNFFKDGCADPNNKILIRSKRKAENHNKQDCTKVGKKRERESRSRDQNVLDGGSGSSSTRGSNFRGVSRNGKKWQVSNLLRCLYVLYLIFKFC